MIGKLLVVAVLVAIAAIVIPPYLPQFFSSEVVQETDKATVKKGETQPVTQPVTQPQPTTTPQPPKQTTTATATTGKIFTADELKLYNGAAGSKGLFLAILGEVFDVEKGRRFYEPGESYSNLAARDASRAFLSGDFTDEGLRDDVLDLPPQTLKGLQEWIDLYHKDYKYVGKLVGLYYNEDGKPTQYLKDVKKGIKAGFQLEKSAKKDKQRFPPCNSEWSRDTGSRVWCTTGSGGIQRKWVGVPRQMRNKEDGGTTCICAGPEELNNPHLKEYPNCPPDSPSCAVPQ